MQRPPKKTDQKFDENNPVEGQTNIGETHPDNNISSNADTLDNQPEESSAYNVAADHKIQDGTSDAAREISLLRGQYLRLMADFENLRKRQAREREEIIKRANEDLLTELLPVLDHLELALAIPGVKEDDPIITGVKMVMEQFVAVLAKFNMTPIDALDTKFDPALHEAMSQLPSADVPCGHVIHQMRRGWNLYGRLFRPAQVVVSAGNGDTLSEEKQ